MAHERLPPLTLGETTGNKTVPQHGTTLSLGDPIMLGTNAQGQSIILPFGSTQPSEVRPKTDTLPPNIENETVEGLTHDKPASSAVDEGEVEASDLLSKADLSQIAIRLQDKKDEMLPSEDARKLLRHANALQKTLEAVKTTHETQMIALSQNLADLQVYMESLPGIYASREQLQRERWQVENEQLKQQALALSRKVTDFGIDGPSDVAYNYQTMNYTYVQSAQDVEGENRLLRSDIKFLKRKLREFEAQSARMESEVKQIRSSLLNGAPLVATDVEIELHTVVTPDANETRDPARRKRLPTMGDAEAEHLLLAGKKLSHIRRISRVPLTVAISEQAEEIVAASHARDMSHYYPDSEQTTPKAGSKAKRYVSALLAARTPPPSPSKDKGGVGTYGKQRRPMSPLKPPRTPSSKPTEEDGSRASTGAGLFGAMDNLLQAAQTVLTPAAMERSSKMITGVLGSPKRQRTSPSSPARRDELGQGWKASSSREALRALQDDDTRPRATLGTAVSTPSKDVSVFSALDVLADQAASASQLGSSPPEAPDSSPTNIKRPRSPQMRSDSTSPVGPGSARRPLMIAPAPSTPSHRLPSEHGHMDPSEYSAAAAAAKRVRSPYIKWNTNEDELLIKAVSQHGLRWDQVASCVPTRTYHQVRQRFLRGLKSGDALPDELAHLQIQVKKSVREYEANRSKNKNRLDDEDGDPEDGEPGEHGDVYREERSDEDEIDPE